MLKLHGFGREIPLLVDSKDLAEHRGRFRADQRIKFRFFPNIITRINHLPGFFRVITKGILRTIKAAVAGTQFFFHELQGLPGDSSEPRIAGRLKGSQVNIGQLSLIEEHFLKLRNRPGPVETVSVESSAQLIHHRPLGHRTQRLADHRLRPLAPPEGPVTIQTRIVQEEFQHGGAVEFGRHGKSAVLGIELCAQFLVREIQHRPVQPAFAIPQVDQLKGFDQQRGLVNGLAFDVGVIIPPQALHILGSDLKTGSALLTHRREVDRGSDRLPSRCQPAMQGPATALVNDERMAHETPVEIRTFLTIYQNADEMLV